MLYTRMSLKENNLIRVSIFRNYLKQHQNMHSLVLFKIELKCYLNA
jgi:hypothetical protein